jgi:hypothetical protein
MYSSLEVNKRVKVPHKGKNLPLGAKFTPNKIVKNRVARFFLVQYTKMGENIPNDHKIYQMAITYFQLT